ncbi:MAG: T9SS type A sorting domain-containing protein, partial [Crocinitomicaceae bacterium]|nr:T9SS type A sorting domain-containing protein [Crocinitomicaceae bacterium]
PGSYAVELTENSCTDTSDCYIIAASSLNTLTNEVSVYPNPSNGSLRVVVSSDSKLRLLDLKGRMVFEEELVSGKHELRLAELKGIYLYQIQTDKTHFAGRIIFE